MSKTSSSPSVVPPASIVSRWGCLQYECSDTSVTGFMGAWRQGVRIRSGKTTWRRWCWRWEGFPRRMRNQPSGKCVGMREWKIDGAEKSQRCVGSSEPNLVVICRYFDSLKPCIWKATLSLLSNCFVCFFSTCLKLSCFRNMYMHASSFYLIPLRLLGFFCFGFLKLK